MSNTEGFETIVTSDFYRGMIYRHRSTVVPISGDK